MAALLQEAAKQDIAPNYVRQLLAAFGKAEGRTSVTQILIEPAPHIEAKVRSAKDMLVEPEDQQAFFSLVDPLSKREIEVLRLLGTELTGPEIARELMVSLNTMYTHTKSIYNKLGVNNRRMAIRRAEELHLL